MKGEKIKKLIDALMYNTTGLDNLLISAIQEAKEDINQLITENQRYESIIHEYEAQENVLEDELDDAQRECTRLINENQELESELEVSKKNTKILLEYSKGLESGLYDCNTRIRQLEQQLEEQKELYNLGSALDFVRVSIDESGFTYDSVNYIMAGYKKRLEGYYNSYTMNQMIDHCKDALKILYPYWYREQKGQ